MKTTENQRLVEYLTNCAYELWKASWSGLTPALAILSDEISKPKIGDIVLEVSTHFRKERIASQSIGRLVSVDHVAAWTPEQWAEQGGKECEPIPTETVYTLSLVFEDGREFKWSNAMFIKAKV